MAALVVATPFYKQIIPHWIFVIWLKGHVLWHNLLATLVIDIFTNPGDGRTILSNNLGNVHMINVVQVPLTVLCFHL